MENSTTRLSPGVKHPGTRDAWFNAGYELLTECGVDAVRIKTLAERVKLTRSGFYWHFKDHNALLDALVEFWEASNTGLLIAQSEAYAETITEGMLNLFDCWHDESKFDPQLDLAIRNWARSDSDLRVRLDSADKQRIETVTTLFRRFNFSEEQAQVRGMAVIYTQIGYISMQVTDDKEMRISRVPHYVEMFTGLAPSASEFARFKSRHGYTK